MKQYRMVIVGLGSAGRSRLKNVEQHPQVELAGIVSRRSEMATLSIEAALQDNSIDAALICSENATHYDYAKMFLAAGKHVLVEFPLANQYAQTAELIKLAQEKNKILHLEVLGLLMQKHLVAKQLFLLHQKNIKQVEYSFSGGMNAWIQQDMACGYYGALCVSRLHALWDLVGPLQLQDHHIKKMGDGFCLKADFKTQKDLLVTFVNVRQTDAPRKWDIVFVLQDGSSISVPEVKDSGGLFYLDFENFVGELEGKKKFLSDATILDVMRVVDQIS